MAFSSTCRFFFSLLVLAMAASPLQTHARESKFFSKNPNPKPENDKSPIALPPSPSPSIAPSPSPLPAEQGYGLFGQEESYKHPLTTTNPTESVTGNFRHVQPNWVKDTSNNNGYQYGAGEKQGMSGTKFLEYENNGKLVENNDGHESYYGHNYENGNHYEKGGYEAGEKQGMSDTRFMENGRYFYDLEAEKKNRGNQMQSSHENSNLEFDNNKNYENEEEEEKYEKEGYGTGEKQGMSDTRFMKNGRYFYDIKGDEKHNYDGNEIERNNGYANNVESYNNNNNNEEKSNEYYEEENNEPEKYGYVGNGNEYEREGGKGYDFRSTQNKFPGHEFDSMKEYEKYEQNKRHHP